ncbi:MAG TPA: SRPBCC domain-containing protein [Polyangiaceae bacterium]
MTGSLQKRTVSATITTNVAVEPAIAFAVFTEEIGAWWLRGPRYRSSASSAPSTMKLETKLGGRLLEIFEDGREPFSFGKITVWEPPTRFAIEWRLSNFAPDEATDVEVRFEPTDTGTRVVVTHSGYHDLRLDHPARHGLDGAALGSMLGRWWGDQASSFRLRALGRKTS